MQCSLHASVCVFVVEYFVLELMLFLGPQEVASPRKYYIINLLRM